jgi:release factor glutamine methyltransferase
LTREETERIAALAQRRLAHEPVARIRGHCEFWSLDFQITKDVLQPRPETETVIEAALAHVRTLPEKSAIRLADLGTGSGIILISLLHELPQATGIGTDRSPAALEVAQENAHRLGVAKRAKFAISDYGSALSGGFHLVLSNPPYIRTNDISALSPEVRLHDPRLALDGGADGLAAYRAIAADARRLLLPAGAMIVEIGIGQEAAVSQLFANAGLRVVQPSYPDLAGIGRVVAAVFDNQNR